MLVVISPAKKLDWEPRDGLQTEPAMQADAIRLAKTARNLTLGDLKSLMHLSDDLARLNRDRFKAFQDAPAPEETRPAMFAFAGDTYQGLEAKSMDDNARAWAQDHLRILSGLYGILRPMDAIQPYRLEMGSRMQNPRGKNLYAYWGAQLSQMLNADAEAQGSQTLINCASQEYFGAVDLKALKLNVITPQFKEIKGGVPKIVSFYAKRARGAMARFVMDNQITEPKDILGFVGDGYAYAPELSTEDMPVFVRAAPNG